ncbi:MAG: hypothetical protein QOE14_2088 [Humisphaera sp.]|nr:hypothetical protein [Humisphaera sp.]
MPQSDTKSPLRIAIVGAGPRSVVYAREALQRPDAMQVVAVADPNEVRRNALADAHGVPAQHRFASHEDLAARPGLADAAINTTLDIAHYATTLPLLRAGYHVLLEKPIAQTEAEVRDLIRVAGEHRRIIMVCHILRYEPFYQTIKQLLAAGAIGRLMSIETAENVSYDHVVTTFVRHPRNLQPTLPMLLSKCCHDLDVLAWLAGGTRLARVASFIRPGQFRPENAPPGSTQRCLDGCAVESTCRYSARAMHVEDDKWDAYAWPANEYPSMPSAEEKLRILKMTSPYGRCAWRAPNQVVDHQSVLIEFADGVTATHDLFCATTRPNRSIRILGAAGEIEGDYTSGQIVLRRAIRGRTGRYEEEHTHVAPNDAKAPSPRACERALLADFIGTVRGDPAAPGITRIEDSLVGHQIAFAADIAARENRVVTAT